MQFCEPESVGTPKTEPGVQPPAVGEQRGATASGSLQKPGTGPTAAAKMIKNVTAVRIAVLSSKVALGNLAILKAAGAPEVSAESI